METFCTAGQATHDSMTKAHCILDIEAYKHTLRIYITRFPLQQCLHLLVPMLRYTHTDCFVISFLPSPMYKSLA
jgi:hypothetical protein